MMHKDDTKCDSFLSVLLCWYYTETYFQTLPSDTLLSDVMSYESGNVASLSQNTH